MPLANPNQNPDGAEAPEQQQQALNRNSDGSVNLFGAPAATADKNSERISQLLEAVKISNDNVVGLNKAFKRMKSALQKERAERISKQLDAGIIPQSQGDISQLQQGDAADDALEVQQLEDSFQSGIEGRVAVNERNIEALQRQMEALQRQLSADTPQEFIA